MKIIFFVYSNSYRDHGFNNFHATGFLGSFLILNLKRNSLAYRLILSLRRFFKKNIMLLSADADPIILDKSMGFNFWFNEPNEIERISPANLALKNNLFFFEYPYEHITVDKFTLYPCRLEKNDKKNSEVKIVYISEMNAKFSDEALKFWAENKVNLLKDISEIESKHANNKYYYQIESTKLYIEVKRLIRMEMVKLLKQDYGDKFLLVGRDWGELGLESVNINYDRSFRRDIYKNNICVDFGAQCGTSIFYQRSSEIIESGGLLVQAIQMDDPRNQNLISNANKFSSYIQLHSILDILLFDVAEFNRRLAYQSAQFPDQLMEEELLKLWHNGLSNYLRR